jgi:hypothetical protein
LYTALTTMQRYGHRTHPGGAPTGVISMAGAIYCQGPRGNRHRQRLTSYRKLAIVRPMKKLPPQPDMALRPRRAELFALLGTPVDSKEQRLPSQPPYGSQAAVITSQPSQPAFSKSASRGPSWFSNALSFLRGLNRPLKSIRLLAEPTGSKAKSRYMPQAETKSTLCEKLALRASISQNVFN